MTTLGRGVAHCALTVALFAGLPACHRNAEDPYLEAAKKAIRASLKDPDSANFQNVFRQSSKPLKAVCGEVNAKNGFGGYVGYSRFFVTDDGQIGVLLPTMSGRDRAEMEGFLAAYCE